MQSKRHTQVPQDPWSKKESNATKDDVKKEGEIEMCSLRIIKERKNIIKEEEEEGHER